MLSVFFVPYNSQTITLLRLIIMFLTTLDPIYDFRKHLSLMPMIVTLILSSHVQERSTRETADKIRHQFKDTKYNLGCTHRIFAD